MSLGALELQSLFRKYQGTLADLDLDQNQNNLDYQRSKRDMYNTHQRNVRFLGDRKASQGMSNSGVALRERTDLEKAYDTANVDADQQQAANLSRIAKKRLDARGAYDEGVALSKMTSLLEKNAGL